ncbi:uncharacterized protein LOC123540561 [Mercenaria mercenaria]|uniref:uncharacterized protein LOC123540561 n=1 Tax=Mercenaria mercenaria TaxID=6596 RepID=UPI00234ED5CB|nr:uncharacterized protein LOC123540561 [Mercenaria mercenaria]
MEMAGKYACACLFIIILLGVKPSKGDSCLDGTSLFYNCQTEYTNALAGKGFGMFQNPDTSIENTIDSAYHLVCSPEYIQYMNCLQSELTKCPDLMNTYKQYAQQYAQSLNLPEQGLGGGASMEEFCARYVGPCSEALKCYTVSLVHQFQNSGIGRKRRASYGNVYSQFQSEAKKLCNGAIRKDINCVSQHIDNCPQNIKTEIRQYFEKALGNTITDFDTTRTFVADQCQHVQSDVEQDTCVNDAIQTHNFTRCYRNVSNIYSTSKTCDVYTANQNCFEEIVKPACGEEKAMFYVRNAALIFKGIPSDCGVSSAVRIKSTHLAWLLFLLAYISLLRSF